MALTQSDEIIEDMFPFDQASATPDKLRKVLSFIMINNNRFKQIKQT